MLREKTRIEKAKNENKLNQLVLLINLILIFRYLITGLEVKSIPFCFSISFVMVTT